MFKTIKYNKVYIIILILLCLSVGGSVEPLIEIVYRVLKKINMCSCSLDCDNIFCRGIQLKRTF